MPSSSAPTMHPPQEPLDHRFGCMGVAGSGIVVLQGGRLSRSFLCKVISRARAHRGFANSKIGQNPLAPPSRNPMHADKNVLPSQACGYKCASCMCVENLCTLGERLQHMSL